MKTFYLLDNPGRDKHFHLYLLKGLREAGFSPTVVYFQGDPKETLFKDFPIFSLGLQDKEYKRFRLKPILKLEELIRHQSPVLLHVQRHRPLVYSALALKFLRRKIPLLYTIRLSRLVRTWNRWLTIKFLTPQITRVIAVSRGAGEDFLKRTGFPKERLVVIPNGIDPEPFDLPLDKETARKEFGLPKGFLFGMVARFRKAKDHVGLIKAFSQVKNLMPRAFLVLSGDGPLEGEIRSLVARLNLEDKIIFTGRISPSKIPRLLKAFDVFVHPTFREGMPAAVLEAMAAGLPIIATDAEGITDIFETSKKFGYLLPRGNQEALEKALYQMYHLPSQEREKMGQEAKNRLLEEFTHKKMVARNLALYQEVLAQL